MSFVYLPEHARGYYKEETSFGVKPTGNFAYIGVIQQASGILDPKLIKLRGLDGTPDLVYIRKGLKAPDISFRYTPRDTTFFAYILQRTKTLSIEYVVADDWASPTSVVSVLFLGQKLSRLTVEVPEEDFINILADCVGQNYAIATSKQADGYDAIPSAAPLSWFDTYIEKNTGGGYSEISRYGKWSLTIDNRVLRKAVVRSTSADLAKYLVATLRDVSGEIEAYFEDETDLDEVKNDTEFDLKLHIATNYFTVSDCKWDRARIPTLVDTYPIKLPLPFTAKTATLT